MAEPRSTMIDPPVESLLDKVDSKFTLVTLSAKRGRQINSYFNQLGEGLGAIVPPQVASVSRKPLSIALEEIAAGKVRGIRLPEAGEGEDGGELAEAGEDQDPVA
ncbi:MAG TPA: DNA-directed RNA polymerase subunit omega [Acidimicrobiales bacterium]|nr:DNA-directed RNA polymerase subunit omega [Acidimicrobiales bacterium]